MGKIKQDKKKVSKKYSKSFQEVFHIYPKSIQNVFFLSIQKVSQKCFESIPILSKKYPKSIQVYKNFGLFWILNQSTVDNGGVSRKRSVALGVNCRWKVTCDRRDVICDM